MGDFFGFSVSNIIVSKHKKNNHFEFLPHLLHCVHFIVKLPTGYCMAKVCLYVILALDNHIGPHLDHITCITVLLQLTFLSSIFMLSG